VVQRVEFQNPRGLKLVGSFFPGGSASVVVMAHGFTSDKSSRGRFPRLAGSLNESGYSALAFDFSGCGESDDDGLTAAKQLDDLKAAVAFVKSRGFQRFILFGHSLGSLICLRAYSPEVATIVLTGALTGPIRFDGEGYFSPEQMTELAETGRLTTTGGGEVPRKVIVEAQMLKDFEEIDQPELLTAVKCPVLIIHGDDDEEERLLLERSRRGVPYLPVGSRLEVLPGASHGFRDHYDQVIQLTLDWLAAHAPCTDRGERHRLPSCLNGSASHDRSRRSSHSRPSESSRHPEQADRHNNGRADQAHDQPRPAPELEVEE
jgi:pimeloyl-ACP methyl ester carboxylesterase